MASKSKAKAAEKVEERKNYLTDETVIVKYLPSHKNGVLDKKHPLYGGLSSNASIAIPAPLLTKGIDKLFDKDELEFLSAELNADLHPSSDFWKEYKKDDVGMPIGIFPIFLKKEGMMLNKRNPEDYIKIRVLENCPIVAPDPSEVQYNKAQYRFVLIKQNEMHKEDIESMSYEKQAIKLHTKYEDNAEVLKYILTQFNRNVGHTSKLPFLQKETWKLVKAEPKLFTRVAEDELLTVKMLIQKALRYKLISTSNKFYYTAEGDPIKLDGEKNDFEGAARYLDSGAGQEYRLELEAKLKLMDK